MFLFTKVGKAITGASPGSEVSYEGVWHQEWFCLTSCVNIGDVQPDGVTVAFWARHDVTSGVRYVTTCPSGDVTGCVGVNLAYDAGIFFSQFVFKKKIVGPLSFIHFINKHERVEH